MLLTYSILFILFCGDEIIYLVPSLNCQKCLAVVKEKNKFSTAYPQKLQMDEKNKPERTLMKERIHIEDSKVRNIPVSFDI